MPKAMHVKFRAVLEYHGSKFVKYTAKYTVMTRRYKTRDGKDTFYYIGRSGGLRVGRSASASVPVSNAYKDKMIVQYDGLKKEGWLNRDGTFKKEGPSQK